MTGLNKISPIFIVGTPRSGTTLTAKIIGNHSKVFMPGETHFYDDIYSKSNEYGHINSNEAKEIVLKKLSTIYKRYNQPGDQERIDRLFRDPEVIKKLMSCNTYELLFTMFMEIQSKDSGKSRWGNQVPRDIFNISQIHVFYPDAKIIICVRDIRDFLTSYKNRWKVTKRKDIKGLKSMYHPVITSSLWKSTIRQIRRVEDVVSAENMFVLNYEYLVMNTEQAIMQLTDFIGEKYEAALLNINFQNSSFESGQSGVFTNSVGRWKNCLSPEEAVVSQWICKDEMSHFGYEPEDIDCFSMKIAWIILTTPIAFISAARASKDMRGKLFAYVLDRLTPLLTKKRFT